MRYAQHCPIARGLELLAEPWTMLIVREMLRGGERTAEIGRGVPGVSPGLLSERISTLHDAGLIEPVPGDDAGERHRLTAAGLELRSIVENLGRWSQRWLPPPDLDVAPGPLMLDISRGVDLRRLPARPVAVQIAFDSGPPPRLWLVLSSAGAVARETDPGIPLSVRLDCAPGDLAAVWLGHVSWLDGSRSGASGSSATATPSAL